jgi:hypothetical protein
VKEKQGGSPALQGGEEVTLCEFSAMALLMIHVYHSATILCMMKALPPNDLITSAKIFQFR